MLNTAILMGRLVADPELRHTPNDIAVTSFTLAVDRSFSKSGTERQTDFIDIVAWRSTAEFVCKYFHKGQLVAVQGSIQTRSYTDSQGIKRKAFEIVADNVHFAESKRILWLIRRKDILLRPPGWIHPLPPQLLHIPAGIPGILKKS